MAGDDEEIRIRAELEGALAADLNIAADAVDDLGDQATETAAELRVLAASANDADRAVDDLGDGAGRTERRLSNLGRRARTTGSDVDSGTKALGRYQQMMERMDAMRFNPASIFGLVKIPAVVIALTSLASAVSALTAAGVAGVAGLGPMVSLVAAMPALFLTGAQSVIVAKQSLNGLGDAVGVLLDPSSSPAAVAEEMSQLTAEGQSLARTIASLAGGPLKDLRNSTQEAIAPRLETALKNAGELLPIVEENAVGTAEVLGDLAVRASEVTRQPLFRAEFARIMATNNQVLDNGGRAGIRLGEGLFHVADGFRPVLLSMSEYAVQGARYLETTAQINNANGDMTSYFEDAWATARAVASVLADIAVGLHNVGEEGDFLAEHMGGGIAETAAEWRAWTESVEGKNTIREWFEDAQPIIDETAMLLHDLVFAFGDLASNAELAPLIAQLRTELLPAIMDLALGVTNDFGPALIDAATAFVRFTDALTYDALATTLSFLVTILNGLLTIFEALPAPMRNTIAAILGVTLGIRALQFLLRQGGAAFAPLINGLTQVNTASKQAATGLTGMPAATARATGAMTGLKSAGAGLMGAMGGPWGLAIGAAVVGLGLYAQAQEESKARVEALTGSLEEQTGAFTDQSRELIARQLLDEGWDNAKLAEYGTNIAEVTDAILQGEEAATRFGDAATEGYNFEWTWTGNLMDGGDDLADLMVQLGSEADTTKSQFADLQTLDMGTTAQQWGTGFGFANDAIRGVAAGTSSLAGGTARLIPSLDQATISSEKLAMAEMNAANKSRDAGGALRGQAGAADRAANAHLRLNDAMTNNLGSYVGFRQSVADATQSLANNKKTLDLHTQAGRDNMRALLNVAEAANAVTNEAQRTEAIREAEKRIRAWAESAGYGKDQAANFAENLFKVKNAAEQVPENVRTNVEMTGAETVLSQLGSIRGQYDSLRAAMASPMGIGLEQRMRREGGLVWPGATFTVGEVGPELLVNASGVHPVAEGGQSTMRFDEMGFILPNEYYEASKVNSATAAEHLTTEGRLRDDAPPARSDDAGPALPPVSFVYQGEGMSKEEYAEWVREAYAKIVQDVEDRRINHGADF